VSLRIWGWFPQNELSPLLSCPLLHLCSPTLYLGNMIVSSNMRGTLDNQSTSSVNNKLFLRWKSERYPLFHDSLDKVKNMIFSQYFRGRETTYNKSKHSVKKWFFYPIIERLFLYGLSDCNYLFHTPLCRMKNIIYFDDSPKHYTLFHVHNSKVK
jgi:hypothetical protein